MPHDLDPLFHLLARFSQIDEKVCLDSFPIPAKILSFRLLQSS